MKTLTSNYQKFLNGKAFGFDLGTASIGYAVRQSVNFEKVGVLLCSQESNDLSNRRKLRRQRRTLRNRNYRRKWFARELRQILNLTAETSRLPDDPISLRFRAIQGEKLTPLELFTALTHLFKRRGYARVPWAHAETREADSEKKKKEGQIESSITDLQKELEEKQCTYPCQLLSYRRSETGLSPQRHWARKIYWPRELLEKEFRALIETQKQSYPLLADKVEWLLYGDLKKNKQGFHVYFKSTEGRNPGILGLRWPRFDNRSPGLDALCPVDDQGRSQHVVRRNKVAFKEAQWQVALQNFRVIDIATGSKVQPDAASLTRLKQLYDLEKRTESVKITEKLLKTWIKEFSSRYELICGQKDLTPGSFEGRARFCTPTLRALVLEGNTSNPQPILQRKNESKDAAVDRYLSEIRHPLVKHRLLLFRNLLRNLVENYGVPDFIIVEAVRSLAENKKTKTEARKTHSPIPTRASRCRRQFRRIAIFHLQKSDSKISTLERN